jgi:FtsP/CotA-like multicopper oxidase with cupredoxin domain
VLRRPGLGTEVASTTYPNSLRLPSGEFDVPLMIADRKFDSNGNLEYDTFNLDGVLGDKYTVNGKIQPFFKVARRKYRFRLLVANPSRFYRFFLEQRRPVHRDRQRLATCCPPRSRCRAST